MTTNKQDIIIRLLLDQRKPNNEVDEERLKILLDSNNIDGEVDWMAIQDALGYSSLQAQAFISSVNAKFGTNLTSDSFMTDKMKSIGGLLDQLD